MKATLIIICFILASCSSMDSSIILEFSVVDENNQSIPQAKIDVSGFHLRVNSNGRACFEGLHSEEDVLLTISAEGFKPVNVVIKNELSSVRVVLMPENSTEEAEFIVSNLGHEALTQNYCFGKN